MRSDGLLKLCTGLFARRGAAQAFARLVARRTPGPGPWRLIVGHADARADGEALLAALRQRLDVADACLVEVGPAVGAHAGPGALVAGLQPAPR